MHRWTTRTRHCYGLYYWCLALLAVATLGLGAAIPAAHAATGHAPARSGCTSVVPAAISSITGWIGLSNMTVQLTGRTCGAVYSNITIDPTGTITNLPTSMVADTYNVATTAPSNGDVYICVAGVIVSLSCSLSQTTLTVNADGSDSTTGNIQCSGNLYPISGSWSLSVSIGGGISGGGSSGGGGTATPELNSGVLAILGLLPLIGIFLYRRRHEQQGPPVLAG